MIANGSVNNNDDDDDDDNRPPNDDGSTNKVQQLSAAVKVATPVRYLRRK